jgi:hypothetical protein
MHESWEDITSEGEPWAKVNSGRKRTSYIEKEYLEKSQNHCSTDNSRTEDIFILNKTLCPQKLFDVCFTNPTSTVGLQLLHLSLLKVMLRYVNDGVTTIKPGNQITGNARAIWSDESSWRCSLHQEEFTFGEHLKELRIRNAWFQQ